MSNYPIQQNSMSKQDIKSPTPSFKPQHSSQSSLLDSPIAQLLGFGSSSSQNKNFPLIPNSTNSNINKNFNINSSSSSSPIYFNSQPTFSETKDSNDNKINENKNFSNRLHHFQPPPLLLPNRPTLQPDFIESPRTQDQEDDFIGDFEFYPGENPSLNSDFNNLENVNNSIFRYSNVNSSPSPRNSTFDRSYAAVNIANIPQNSSLMNGKAENNQSNSSSSITKNVVNRNGNKNIINLNLVTSPKLKPYMSSPFSMQNSNSKSTFANIENKNNNQMDTKSIVFNDVPTPSPQSPSFIFSNNNYNNSEVDVGTNKFVGLQNSSKPDLQKNVIISESRNSNVNIASGLKPLFTDASRTILKLENDISALKSSLAEIHNKYANKYKNEKEKYRKSIIAMVEWHREELNYAIENNDDSFNYNQPIISTTPKRSSRSKNKNRNSNRRIRHDDIDDNPSEKQSFNNLNQINNQFPKSKINFDQVNFEHNSGKILKCIGSTPPSISFNDNMLLSSPLKISRTSGQPMLHSHPDSVIHVRIPVQNKKDLFINDPKIKSLLLKQREEIIALNEESNSRLALISEEAANAEKQINDRIDELSASKNSKNNTSIVTSSDTSSSSPNAFYIDESDGSAKDEFAFLSIATPTNSSPLPSKYSSSSSSLSSSSLSSSNSKMNQEQNFNSNNKLMKNKQSLISVSGKSKNAPQRLLRHIP